VSLFLCECTRVCVSVHVCMYPSDLQSPSDADRSLCPHLSLSLSLSLCVCVCVCMCTCARTHHISKTHLMQIDHCVLIPFSVSLYVHVCVCVCVCVYPSYLHNPSDPDRSLCPHLRPHHRLHSGRRPQQLEERDTDR